MTNHESLEKSPAYRCSSAAVAAALGSDARDGLTTADANIRLQHYGQNILPSAPPTPAWLQFLAQFANPLTMLLLVAAIISLIVWWIEHESPFPYEALTIFAIVLLNGLLGYVQEHRAEQAVAALQAMTVATARVVRDGTVQTLPTAEIVPGDILVIEEGDTIAADARVLDAIALRVAEAALTGESAPVSKKSASIEQEVGIADQTNMLFGGTAVAAGRGRAIVTATGTATQIGRIAGSLEQTVEKETPLQRELDHVGKWLGLVVILIAIVMSVTILLVDRVGALSELVDIFLLAVSLAVAAVPEGLTAITTIVLSLGMQRMARRHVIVRKLSAVETLGSTTVICTDKTGTLTQNEMTVRAVITASGRVDFTGTGYTPQGMVLRAGQPLADPLLKEEVETALRAAYLVNNASLLLLDGSWVVQGDPTEGALLVAAHKMGLEEEDLQGQFPRLCEVPFSSERKLMSTAHHDVVHGERILIYSKGAPDVLLARCAFERVGCRGQIIPLTEERRTEILAQVACLAMEALRTLGVASRALEREKIDEIGELDERMEQDLIWLGVIGMIDPPRPEAALSVQRAQQAGVRVLMITGDHPATAVAIAHELGILKEGERAMSGLELERASDEEFQAMVRTTSVYARVAPEHKLRIVQALKANGEIVAMTGDGVNDAPALRAADIGVAMGKAGTSVAKEAADMVLTDDNFASMVAAIEEGRAIFANIQKFLRYLLSSNIGEVLTMFFGVILASILGLIGEAGTGLVVPLLSTQILWINLLTDSGPALALGVDPRDPRQMRKPPRDPKTRVISASMWCSIGVIGVLVALATLLVMDWSLPQGLLVGAGTLRYAQTMAFTTLVLAQLFNVFNARSDETSAFLSLLMNRWAWLAIFLSLFLQVLVIYLPFLSTAFGTVPLSITDWLFCLVVASIAFWGRELTKLLTRYSLVLPRFRDTIDRHVS
jgi:Ca2+-transporting ATPase